VKQALGKDLTGLFRVENLGNSLRSEQYNQNVPMPRSVVVGANFRF